MDNDERDDSTPISSQNRYPQGGLPIPVEALVEVSIHIESALRRSGILRYVRRIDIHEQGLEGRGLDECSGQQYVGLF